MRTSQTGFSTIRSFVDDYVLDFILSTFPFSKWSGIGIRCATNGKKIKREGRNNEEQVPFSWGTCRCNTLPGEE
jgi:hypothetical protein